MDTRNIKEKLVELLLEQGRTKREVMELVVRAVLRNFPHLSDQEQKDLAWEFCLELTREAQRQEA